LLAAGSFNGYLGLFDLRHRIEPIASFRDLEENPSAVMQVQFSEDGWFMFSSSRKTNTILQWDLRTGSLFRRLSPRIHDSCQRLRFDLSDLHLLTGDSLGNLIRFDLKDGVGSVLLTESGPISCASIDPHNSLKVAISVGQRTFDPNPSDANCLMLLNLTT